MTVRLAMWPTTIHDTLHRNMHFEKPYLRSQHQKPRSPFVRRDWVVPAALLLCISAGALPAIADVIELSGGGQLEGKILPNDESNRLTSTIELAAGGRVTVSRSQITKIDPVSDVEAEYNKVARSSPDTVESHWNLAEFCRAQKLVDRRRQHLERILELAPNHKEARAALGFRQKNGQWMNRDDEMASRGMVLYQGQWMAPQQVELLKQQKESRVTQADWNKKVELLRRWLTSRRQDQAAQARVEILAIRDPQAADAVVAALRREHEPDLKRMWIEVASQIDNRTAVNALVDLSLNDPDEEIRHDCLEYLVKARRPGLITPYIRALKDKDNVIINRAGAALGLIGDRDAIGPLVDALITRHVVKAGEGNPDQQAYTFTPDSGAFSFGGSGPQIQYQSVRNRSVLDALISLAGGTSFDYDQTQWRGWLAAQAKAAADDIRRDK